MRIIHRFCIATIVFILSANVPALAKDNNPAQMFEKAKLQESNGWATRNDTQLHLHLTDGNILVLANNDGEDVAPEQFIVYFYNGLIAGDQFFIIDKNGYDDSTTLLISRTDGKQYDITNMPHLSPDGKFIITAGQTEEKPGVFLWEIKNGELNQKFNYAPTGNDYALYDFSRWSDATHAYLIKTGLCKRKLVKTSVRLVQYKGVWKLQNMSQADSKC